MKIRRYPAARPVPLDDRRWPGAVLTAPPRWLSTDLRDGNQALPRPMSPERKLMMFDLLVSMGYKEIEVGFPAASQDDYDFVRLLVERDRIPGDVWVSVLVPARDELIERTMASLSGAPRATLHLYNATSPIMRRLVFGMNRNECKDLGVLGTHLVMKYADKLLDGCDIRFQYSPEHFNDTEPDFSLEVCEAVMDVWQPGPDRPIILNFPATVERTTPNVFADQIEWMHRNLSRREHVCLSVHPHNDRGTGVAATELAMLAGAERVEGCLFGNGERAGNVCLVTLGLNLATQGVDPGIDFGDLDHVRRTVEECTGLPVARRHPYGGELVFTAFSGGHQDAIKKGFEALEREAARMGGDPSGLPWEVPYLPVDPPDVGRTYETVVRVTSQSGKAGPAYLLNARYGRTLPRGLQVELAQAVQAVAEAHEGEVPPERIMRVFEEEFAPAPVPLSELRGAVVTLHIDGGPYLGDPAWARAVTRLREVFRRDGVRVREVHAIDGVPARAPGDPVLVYAQYDAPWDRSPGDAAWEQRPGDVAWEQRNGPGGPEGAAYEQRAGHDAARGAVSERGAERDAAGRAAVWGAGAGTDVVVAATAATGAAGARARRTALPPPAAAGQAGSAGCAARPAAGARRLRAGR